MRIDRKISKNLARLFNELHDAMENDEALRTYSDDDERHVAMIFNEVVMCRMAERATELEIPRPVILMWLDTFAQNFKQLMFGCTHPPEPRVMSKQEFEQILKSDDDTWPEEIKE